MTDSEIQTLQNLSDEGFSFCKTVLQEEKLSLNNLKIKYGIDVKIIKRLLYREIGSLTINELIEAVSKIKKIYFIRTFWFSGSLNNVSEGN